MPSGSVGDYGVFFEKAFSLGGALSLSAFLRPAASKGGVYAGDIEEKG